MKTLFLFVFLSLAGLTGRVLAEEMVVVVAASSEVRSLSHNEVVNIFMGRYRRLPSGEVAYPFDLPYENAEHIERGRHGKAAFYEGLLGKSLSEVNAYWARLVFSGNTAPPQSATDHGDMLRRVAQTPGGIGYLPRSALKPNGSLVRIVHELKAP